MKHLLNKEELIKYNEAAVAWEKSALGILTSALFRPISWLKGSIKKGLKKQQMNILVKQWGMEYASALKAVDTGEEQIQGQAQSPEKSITYSEEEKNNMILELQAELKQIKIIGALLDDPINWTMVDTKEKEFQLLKKQLTGKNLITTAFEKIFPNFEIADFDKEHDFDTKVSYVNDILSKIQNSNSVRDLLNVINIGDFKKIITNTSRYIFEDIVNAYEALISTIQKPAQDNNFNESLINEAKEYELPNSIQDILPKENIDQLKNIPDIKKASFEKLNKIRLNTILYEAKYLIERAKNAKNKDRDDNSAELQKIWDIGIQNVNDHFQDVIDTEKVMKIITGVSDKNTKAKIQSEQEDLDELQALEITEVFSVGSKFDTNKLYALKAELFGQTGKKENFILLLSPTTEFVDKEGDNSYYWFRFFGAYKFNQKKNIIERINVYLNQVYNQKMKSEFINNENSYYVCFENLRPTNKYSYMYTYSNKGGLFFNNRIYPNGADAKNDLSKFKKDSLDKSFTNIFKISNMIKIKIDQRFEIDSNNVAQNKYPGIQEYDLKSDQFRDKAVNNHREFITSLK